MGVVLGQGAARDGNVCSISSLVQEESVGPTGQGQGPLPTQVGPGTDAAPTQVGGLKQLTKYS